MFSALLLLPMSIAAEHMAERALSQPAVQSSAVVDHMLQCVSGNVLTVLPDSVLQAAVKQMLKPFKPAEDRFEGLDTDRSEDNGCVVLKDAASYVSCTIKDRLEAGDHWIVYATVDGGKVLAETDPTAVHHRKIGTTY